MKPKYNIKLLLMILFFTASIIVSAEESKSEQTFKVHSLYQNNMVIQRSKPIVVKGWSKPGDKVTVSFAGKTAAASANNKGKNS